MTKDGTMKRADDYLDVTADSLTVTYKDVNGQEKTAQTYTQYYQMAKDYCRLQNRLQRRLCRKDRRVIKLEVRWKIWLLRFCQVQSIVVKQRL